MELFDWLGQEIDPRETFWNKVVVAITGCMVVTCVGFVISMLLVPSMFRGGIVPAVTSAIVNSTSEMVALKRGYSELHEEFIDLRLLVLSRELENRSYEAVSVSPQDNREIPPSNSQPDYLHQSDDSHSTYEEYKDKVESKLGY